MLRRAGSGPAVVPVVTAWTLISPYPGRVCLLPMSIGDELECFLETLIVFRYSSDTESTQLLVDSVCSFQQLMESFRFSALGLSAWSSRFILTSTCGYSGVSLDAAVENLG